MNEVTHELDDASMTLVSSLVLPDGQVYELTHSWRSREEYEGRLELTKGLAEQLLLIEGADRPLHRHLRHLRLPFGLVLWIESVYGIERLLLPHAGVGRSKNGRRNVRAGWGRRLVIIGRRHALSPLPEGPTS